MREKLASMKVKDKLYMGYAVVISMMIILGVMTIIVGLQGDIIAANRKLLEDIQYHVRKLDYDHQEKKDEEE